MAVYAVLGLCASAAIPLAYQVAVMANLALLARTKRYELFRFTDIGLTLLLPFLLRWSLGVFAASSGVMLWALLAPLGALMFDPRRAAFWFAAFLALTAAFGVLDQRFAERAASIPTPVVVTFFALNFGAVSTYVFLQVRYFVRGRERTLAELAEKQRLLELEREKSKLAALGTMAAGLMHELNNPAAALGRNRGAAGGAIHRPAGAERAAARAGDAAPAGPAAGTGEPARRSARDFGFG